MNSISTQTANNIITPILDVVKSLVLGILGIQTLLLLLPVYNRDKRFNQ